MYIQNSISLRKSISETDIEEGYDVQQHVCIAGSDSTSVCRNFEIDFVLSPKALHSNYLIGKNSFPHLKLTFVLCR